LFIFVGWGFLGCNFVVQIKSNSNGKFNEFTAVAT
jgi:hypothetical protein